MTKKAREIADLKNRILSTLKESETTNILQLEGSLKDLIASRDLESKSSMGDKHETSRARIQSEIDRLSVILSKAKEKMRKLSELEATLREDFGPGALVFTSQGNYFICDVFGKMTIEDDEFIAVSTDSPLAHFLKNLCLTQSEEFRGRSFEFYSLA